MKVAQIKDLANLAEGSTIGEMRVTIKKAFPPRTGKGKFGDWRVQNCIISDGTGEARASFWLPSEMKDFEGQMLTLRSQAGKKGLAGISVQWSDHSSSNELKVTEQAAIVDDAGGKVAEVAAQAARIPQHKAAVSSPADAKKFLFQCAQLMVDAIKASHWVGEQVKCSPEQLQAIASSLFISGDRAGLSRVYPTGVKVEEPVKEQADDEEGDEIGF